MFSGKNQEKYFFWKNSFFDQNLIYFKNNTNILISIIKTLFDDIILTFKNAIFFRVDILHFHQKMTLKNMSNFSKFLKII